MSKRTKVKTREGSGHTDIHSLLLEQLESLPHLEAYALEQASLTLMLNQAVKDLINCDPNEHARINQLQGQCKALERAIGINKLMREKVRDEINRKAVQAPAQDD